AGGLDPQPQVPVAEVQVRVAGQRPGQQMRLAQDLEAVADAEYGQAGAGGGRERLHHRGEPGDGTAPQVVAVGEAAGEDDRVHALQVGLGVPEPDRLGSGEPDRPGGVTVVERARERHHPDLHEDSSSAAAGAAGAARSAPSWAGPAAGGADADGTGTLARTAGAGVGAAGSAGAGAASAGSAGAPVASAGARAGAGAAAGAAGSGVAGTGFPSTVTV